jgi:hypothetical protein
MVLPGARKFVELGIRPKREIEEAEPLESLPRSIVEDALEDGVEEPIEESDDDSQASADASETEERRQP